MLGWIIAGLLYVIGGGVLAWFFVDIVGMAAVDVSSGVKKFTKIVFWLSIIFWPLVFGGMALGQARKKGKNG